MWHNYNFQICFLYSITKIQCDLKQSNKAMQDNLYKLSGYTWLQDKISSSIQWWQDIYYNWANVVQEKQGQCKANGNYLPCKIHVTLILILSICLWFNATLNNTSVISLQSILLVEEAGAPTGNHWQVTDKPLSREIWVKYNLFLYGTKSGANSRHIGGRL